MLGPLLFGNYMLPLGDDVRSYGISFQCYADDTQINISVQSKESSQILKVECSLTAIKSWMTQNYLQLNKGKTEQTIFGPKQLQTQLKAGSLCFDGLVFQHSAYVKTCINMLKV